MLFIITQYVSNITKTLPLSIICCANFFYSPAHFYFLLNFFSLPNFFPSYFPIFPNFFSLPDTLISFLKTHDFNSFFLLSTLPLFSSTYKHSVLSTLHWLDLLLALLINFHIWFCLITFSNNLIQLQAIMLQCINLLLLTWTVISHSFSKHLLLPPQSLNRQGPHPFVHIL